MSARFSSAWLVVLGALLALAVSACTSSSPVPPTVGPGPRPTIQRTATPVPPNDEAAIRQIVNAECEAVVQQDVDRLQGLWASNGVVTDANHTKDNPADDVTWKNWEALRDRYVNIIFPSNPTFCEHPDIQVTITGTAASATSSVKIGVTNCKDCNAWTFTKGNDGWRIASLTYNLNPQ